MATDFHISTVQMQPNAARPYGTSIFDPIAKSLNEAHIRGEAIEVHPMSGAQRRSLTQLFARQQPGFRVRSKTSGDGFILWLEQKADDNA